MASNIQTHSDGGILGGTHMGGHSDVAPHLGTGPNDINIQADKRTQESKDAQQARMAADRAAYTQRNAKAAGVRAASAEKLKSVIADRVAKTGNPLPKSRP